MATASSHDDALIEGINVTPLVDIALVLLIVFLVTAKFVVSSGLPITPPVSAHGAQVENPFALELGADGRVLVGGEPAANDAAILAAARAAKARDPEIRALVRADGTVPHARVIRALDLLKDAGITRVAFGVQAGNSAPLVQ
jgi:biopolymer transport protein ExbD